MVGAALGCLAACAPGLPKGVSATLLDAAIEQRLGDPNTCVLIGPARSGAVTYRYGSHVVCAQAWPACVGVGPDITPKDTLKTAITSRRTASCPSGADPSRSVGWAAGPVPGRAGLAYSAVMEGQSTPPGVVIAEKLEGALKAAGL